MHYKSYLCKETGEIFYTSEMGDSDELPEDIDDTEKYISIPHKNELDLGRALVLEFTSAYLPEELDEVYLIFRHKGAYSRYKDLLERKGALEDWYQFENERRELALKGWCQENQIELKG
jgi:hypothetical protein